MVTTGKKAVELAAIDPPDLILCDTVLPGTFSLLSYLVLSLTYSFLSLLVAVMSGVEVLRAVKERVQLQRIPFLFIITPSGEKLEGMNESADDYLVPVSNLLQLFFFPPFIFF